MNEFSGLGKILIVIGGLIALAGVLLITFNKIPFFGKLPGDFSFKGKDWAFHFPLATSILLSIVLSLILYLMRKI